MISSYYIKFSNLVSILEIVLEHLFFVLFIEHIKRRQKIAETPEIFFYLKYNNI